MTVFARLSSEGLRFGSGSGDGVWPIFGKISSNVCAGAVGLGRVGGLDGFDLPASVLGFGGSEPLEFAIASFDSVGWFG